MFLIISASFFSVELAGLFNIRMSRLDACSASTADGISSRSLALSKGGHCC
ncbi:hypothetical protein BgiBS90_021854 [Biomphalaria glabrata]|nr:hypothetical protein BgiBS90_021854 [Biomphalaria glabrata]